MADLLGTLQLHLLESRKAALSHELVSITSAYTVPTSTDTNRASDDSNLLANLFSRNQHSHIKSLEKFHRLAGITLFIPNNPNEKSISQDGKPDEFLGIRFETMQNGTFEVPHYVILWNTFEDKEQYVLHRHTIPLFIPLDRYADEFLGRGKFGLEEFAVKVHRQLILLSNRTATVAKLKSLRGVEQVNVDEAMRLVELVTAKWTAKIILQDEGERCIVVDKDNRRLQDVERVVLGDPEKDLVDRISQAL